MSPSYHIKTVNAQELTSDGEYDVCFNSGFKFSQMEMSKSTPTTHLLRWLLARWYLADDMICRDCSFPSHIDVQVHSLEDSTDLMEAARGVHAHARWHPYALSAACGLFGGG